jgi:hypothetical protein
MSCSALQVIAKSAVASAVAQEVLRLGNSNSLQQRVANSDTVVSGIHIPEGTNIWLFPRQVHIPTSASCVARMNFFVLRVAREHSRVHCTCHVS